MSDPALRGGKADLPAFGGGDWPRRAELRAAMVLPAAGDAAQVLPVWAGMVALWDGGGLCHLPRMPDAAGVVFLGQRPGAAPVFAADLGTGDAPPDLPPGAIWADLRQMLADLPPDDGAQIAAARAVLHWHRSHGFCAACGSKSTPVMAGWQRDCPACGTSHFPRTDPVVIMLVTDGDHLLLGRNAVWPEGMYSTLAGFMEPGETIEAAVRREVQEETGVQVGDVRYLACQPWPFPASLMLGCHGQAISRDITIDPAELEDALWVSKSELLSVAAGLHPKLKPLRKGSIAAWMIGKWLADDLD